MNVNSPPAFTGCPQPLQPTKVAWIAIILTLHHYDKIACYELPSKDYTP